MKIIKITAVITVIGIMTYISIPQSRLPSDAEIDKIVILKSKRQMMVYQHDILLKTYKISLGRNPLGTKQFEGDKKTPEGLYYINDKNPNSLYHKNLGISYPNQKDTEHARSSGKNPGGDIKIHGLRNGLGFISKFHRLVDWTSGCIAVTNSEIEELYNHTPIGTPIEIKE